MHTVAQGASTARDMQPETYTGQPLEDVTTAEDEQAKDLEEMPTATEKHYKIRAALGLPAKAAIKDEHDRAPQQMLLWPRVRLVLREPFTEFWGTFILIMFGCGSVAQVTLSQDMYGGYQSISWG